MLFSTWYWSQRSKVEILLFGLDCQYDVFTIQVFISKWTNQICFPFSGFAVIKELTIEVEKAVPSQKSKPQEVQSDKLSTVEVSQTSPSNGENQIEKAEIPEKTETTNSMEKTEKPSKNIEPMADNGATNLDCSETIAEKPASPGASSMLEDPEDHQLPIRHDGSPHANTNSR